VAGEAAVFSLGRILGRGCHTTIKRYLGDERRFVAAAAIEALAKYVGPPAWDDIVGSQYHRCPDTNTAFHRAVYYLRPKDIATIASVEFKEPDPRVRLSAARSLARIGSHDQVCEWLSSSDIDATSRTAFDEVLFARPPFVPAWFKYFDKFDPSVAALDVRLTNLDPERLPQAVYSDQVRTINAFMAKPADETTERR
jgi:HEAT repeat protein